MSVAEIRILRWMSGVLREDRVMNKYVRRSIGISSIVDKVRKNRRMWEIVSSGGLRHRWPTPNSWDKGEGEDIMEL